MTGCKDPYCILLLLSTEALREGNLLPPPPIIPPIPAPDLEEEAESEELPAPTSSGRRFPLGGRGGTRLLKLATISGGEWRLSVGWAKRERSTDPPKSVESGERDREIRRKRRPNNTYTMSKHPGRLLLDRHCEG